MFGTEHDFVIPLNLIILALLVHTTDDCIICQPNANYRPLCLGDIQQKEFLDAMLLENQGIREEMYVFFYDIKDVDENNTTDENNGVPIFPTYSMNENTVDINPISGKIATFPSDRSILRFADLMGVTQVFEKFQCLGNDLIRKVMKEVTSKQSKLIEKGLFSTSITQEGKTVKKPATGLNISKNFRKIRKGMQGKTKLRVAIVGGFHRTASATHMLENYKIHSGRSLTSHQILYEITKSSSLNSEIAVHVIYPVLLNI